MNNKNTYYELNQEKLNEYARNRYCSKNDKAKSKEYYENNKKRLQRKFHHHKTPILINKVNIDEILIYNKVSFSKKGYKYFIGYKDDHYKIKPLCIMLPKLSGYDKCFGKTKYLSFLIKIKPLCKMLPKLSRYGKCFDKTKYLSFLIKDDELLKEYNKIWDNISIASNSIKKVFDSEP